MAGADFEHEALVRLARIEAQLEVKCSARGERMDDMQKAIDDHEERIRPLEKHHTRMLTVAAGSGVIGSLIVKGAVWLWGAR